MVSAARSSPVPPERAPRASRQGRAAPCGSWALPVPPLPHMVRSQGARRWSAGGEAFIDFDNRGGAVLLGHADADVAAAVRRAEGVEIAALKAATDERLVAMTPMRRRPLYGADIAEALGAAMACARAVTGRALILACDAGGGRVPTARHVSFNDLARLERLMAEREGQVAAIVLAALGSDAPAPGYLAGVRRMADTHGALVILDETLSGFRIHNGGAQGFYGIRADLVVFGDSLANGAPFGAVAGPRDLIRAAPRDGLAPRADALAAAAAVLTKIEVQAVVTCLRVRGAEIQAEVSAALDDAGVGGVVQVVGDPAVSTLAFSPFGAIDAASLKRFWIREAAQRRVISLAAHNISYAHGESEIEALIKVSGQIAQSLALALHRDAAASRSYRPALRPTATVQ